MSANNKDIVWPPQTTQDVLNLTPRKNRQQQFSPSKPPLSPSPLRKSSQPALLDSGSSTEIDDDDDEDEEMLKLKLQRIEAKLKLKKLQRQQKRRRRRQIAAQPPSSPKSPSRVLLGIDRGLKGKDVSLRRAPQYRKPPPGAVRAPSPSRPVKTFNQRIIEERDREKSKFEQQQRIKASRSKGFGLDSDGGGGGAGIGSISTSAAQQATHSFTSILSQYDQPKSAVSTSFSFSNSSRALVRPAEPTRPSSAPASPEKEESIDEAGFDSFSGLHLLRRSTPHATVVRHLTSKAIYQLPQLLKIVVSPAYEPPDVEGDWVVLATVCSKSEPRNVGQNTNAEKTGKKYMVVQLTDLKWEIELFLFGAGFERFWKIPVGTVVAILNPGVMKPRNNDSGKFSLTIADDAADCLLEIGLARDLGFCKSTKRDGKQCGTWVDKRHTNFCAFHVEQTVKKARVARAEVNSMTSLFSPPKKGTVKPRRFFAGGGGSGLGSGRGRDRDDGLLREGPITDMPQRMGGAGGNIFVAPSRSTAALLDDEDYLASNFHRGTKEERLHKRLEDGKRERELTKRIIEAQGREGGIGTQYLRTRMGETVSEKEKEKAAREAANKKQVSEALSMLRSKNDARDIRLSPIRRKRPGPPPMMAPVIKKTRFALAPEISDDDDDLDIVHG
ncbi:hypothetical protein BDD12DRAFT_802818 [Trichophaea hybrida]|nr:hypothetical protein BDD12DRAFT_802818 [Trichophaea hybrida]